MPRPRLALPLRPLLPALSLATALALIVPLAAAAGPGRPPTVLGPEASDAQLCATPGGVRVLADDASGASAQQAIWIDGERLRWSAPAGAARVELLGSPSGGLRVTVGERPQGATLRRALSPSDAAHWPAGDRRFSHVDGRLFALAAPLADADWSAQWRVAALDADGRVLAATGVQIAGALDARFAAAALALPMGATPVPDGRRFTLWAPTARRVALCLFDPPARAGADPTLSGIEALAFDAASGAWSTTRPGEARGQRYAYLVDVHVPGVGLVRNRTTDPWALGLDADSRHAVVLDLDDPATQPAGWAEDRRPDSVRHPTDMVIYELHVRDFSRDDASVPAADRGRYRGFLHRDSAGMRHLRALREAGLTDVHLLPTYDLATVPERDCVVPALPVGEGPVGDGVQAAIGAVRERDCYNWGYDPWHYTVPEGSYASDADDAAARVREFRAMVQALHQDGLRVGLDVVYNHTMAAGQDAQSVLDRIVPGYYHRLDADGAVETSTCCPNTATEATMMARLMIDSAVVWARDYRIDSFRFDLMGHQPREAMRRLQQAVDAATGRRIDLIGEGWNFGEVADGARFVQASQLELQHSGIGTFSDRMRDAARGGRAGDRGDALSARGWLTGNPTAEAAAMVRAGLAGTLRDLVVPDAAGSPRRLGDLAYGGQPLGYVAEPGEVVNYTENHDNLTLFDSNALRLPLDTPRHERARVQVLGNALVLLSQGIAYLHAGQEILRSKSLDRNSYNSGDAFNTVDWTLATNHFGTGLPPAWDNEDSWPQMRRVLAQAEAIAPRPEDLRFTLAATLDLLAIRRDEPLLRLRSSAEVQRRLRVLDSGDPALVLVRIDGRGAGAAGADRPDLLVALNAAPDARDAALDGERGRDWRLHPRQARDGAGDPRAREVRFDAATGRLRVPGRTAVVLRAPHAPR